MLLKDSGTLRPDTEVSVYLMKTPQHLLNLRHLFEGGIFTRVLVFKIQFISCHQ